VSKVVSLPPKTVREAGIRKVVHELPPNASLPGALLFALIGNGLIDATKLRDEQATQPAAAGTGHGR